MYNKDVDRHEFSGNDFAAGSKVTEAVSSCGCGCQIPAGQAGTSKAQKEATIHTKEINDAVYALLDFSDEQEKEFATRGLIAAPEALEIKNDNGKVVWSQKAYSFLDNADGTPAKAPDTANPSLWRNAQLNHLYGLFEVTDGIYQVRGYDMTNITFIKGNTGWIIFDPLMSVECSRAAFALVTEHLGKRPVMAIVISHPHVDHYGGIRGVITPEEVKERNIPIIVPEDFEKHAIAENLYAGKAMARRASYQYGTFLKKNVKGGLSIGIGMGQSLGRVSYISPNDIITHTGEKRVIDGIEMEFQMTPGTEAPAEMNTWFPQKKALWMAENCTGTLHNLYTLRGAQVRDGNAWANYLMETIALYGKEAELTFQSHNWPHFGNDVVNEYITNTAAVYKFINDQTLMYLNQGYTGTEISHMIKLPEKLEKVWYTRQYYGTVAHNARAVYQKYMGFYDANPVNLHPLSPEDYAKKLVEYLGDTDAVLARAKADFDKGEYQWVAQITNALVFADPQNQAARLLCADALEQLGYQAESGTWRNVYLTAALELRNGVLRDDRYRATGSPDTMRAIPPYMILEYYGIILDANAAADLNLTVNLRFTDEEPYTLLIRSSVVLYQKGVLAEDADATLTLPRLGLLGLLAGNKEAVEKNIKVEGDVTVLTKLTRNLKDFDFFFNIIEP